MATDLITLDRQDVLDYLKSETERDTFSLEVVQRDGSTSIVYPPILVGENEITFCTGRVLDSGIMTVRFDQIVNMKPSRSSNTRGQAHPQRSQPWPSSCEVSASPEISHIQGP